MAFEREIEDSFWEKHNDIGSRSPGQRSQWQSFSGDKSAVIFVR